MATEENRSQTIAHMLQEGMGLHQRGKIAEAAAFYRRVLTVDPQQFDALHLLGVISAQQGEMALALELLRKAARARPDDAEVRNNLGMALNLSRLYGPAVTELEHATKLQPTNAFAHNNLGVALQALKQWRRAATCFERAIALRPGYHEALSNLGGSLHWLKRDEEAIKHLRTAIAASPRFAEAHANLAVGLLSTGQIDAALESANRAVSLAPENPVVIAQQGTVYLALGRLDEARGCFEAAIRRAPRNADYYAKLVACYRVGPSDPYLQTMEALAKQTQALPSDDVVELHFALGKAYADLGDNERSFEHLLSGNALKRRTITYDEPDALRFFERIETVFSAELMQTKSGHGSNDQAPIFIVGMMRSGSTLIEQILASHRDVYAAGERSFFFEAYETVRREAKCTADFPEFVSDPDDDRLAKIGEKYMSRLRALPSAAKAARITDKMLGNFTAAGLIHLALPNARIIHARRDPIDTCLSAFSKLFTDNQPYAYDLGELARHHCAYARLMDHWRDVLPAGTMLEVQYEELVADLEGQARRIIAHCGLEWDEACLSFYKTGRVVQTASAAQVRQPIYRNSVGRWRPAATILQPLVDGLGTYARS